MSVSACSVEWSELWVVVELVCEVQCVERDGGRTAVHVFCHVTVGCIAASTHPIIAHRPPLSDRSPSAVDIGYCGHGTPPGRQDTPPLEAVVCWRAISSLSLCLRATTETSPHLTIPSPRARAITESTPSKSNQSASSRPVNSSAHSAVFNQIPPLPPSIRPASPAAAAARHTNKLPDLPSIPSLWLPQPRTEPLPCSAIAGCYGACPWLPKTVSA